MRGLVVIAVAVAFALPALASSPGEPLGCSDWVFLEPGISCGVFVADCMTGVPADPAYCTALSAGLPTLDHDNEGRIYRVVEQDLPPIGLCTTLKKTSLVRHDGSQESVVAYIEDRCVDPATTKADAFRVLNKSLVFDANNGRFLAPVEEICYAPGPPTCDYVAAQRVIAFNGFATIFEILQTYTPPSGPISFRVPYMPEGFQAADYFDTYYGDLATLGDWSQVQPLQCGYPASPPSVGDYLTVADPLPTPSPGQGYYYVTAVTYGGQTRYGRRRMGGVLSGRDAAVLPGCTK